MYINFFPGAFGHPPPHFLGGEGTPFVYLQPTNHTRTSPNSSPPQMHLATRSNLPRLRSNFSVASPRWLSKSSMAFPERKWNHLPNLHVFRGGSNFGFLRNGICIFTWGIFWKLRGNDWLLRVFYPSWNLTGFIHLKKMEWFKLLVAPNPYMKDQQFHWNYRWWNTKLPSI